jgi:hypothetical protein
MVFLLPYLEEGNLAKLWNPHLIHMYYRQTDPKARQTASNLFYCPSRRSKGPEGLNTETDELVNTRTRGMEEKGLTICPPWPGATADYAAVGGGDNGTAHEQGTLRWVGASRDLIDTRRGQWRLWNWPPSPTRMASVIDGSSNTIVIGEKHLRRQGFGKANEFHHGDGPIYNDDLWPNYVRVVGRTILGPWTLPGGMLWKTQKYYDFPLAQGPNDDYYPAGYRFGSWHPNVCQFCFADGTVRPLANNMNIITLTHLARPDDGEIVGDF